MISRTALIAFCDELLQPQIFHDFAPNGLQVEGTDEVKKIVTGVTASQALIDAAIAKDADAIIVHHGFFWKNESIEITGMKYRRIRALIQNDINLIAYHLPLDGHQGLGNNAALVNLFGLIDIHWYDESYGAPLAVHGRLTRPLSNEAFADLIAEKLGRNPIVIEGHQREIQTVGICSGGAQNYISDAANLGLDAYVSGEISEHTTHIAREMGISYFAAGHHATERSGVQNLGEVIADKFNIDVEFIDIPNPA